MRLIASAIRAVLLGSLVLGAGLSPTVAMARRPPPRIDNIWDGHAHQPTEAEVRSLEHTNPAAQRTADDEVDQLYQRLMRQSAG